MALLTLHQPPGPLAGDPRVAAFEDLTRRLARAGEPFEVVEEDVRGVRMAVFADRPRSLRQVLVEGAARGDADAYVFGNGTPRTFANVERDAARIAASLAERYGIGPGDRVAVCATICPEWVQLFWALPSMNAVVVAMNGWWTGSEMRNTLDLTAPSLVVMDEKRLARLVEE